MKPNNRKKYKVSKKLRKVQESSETYSASQYPHYSGEQLLTMFQETRRQFQETRRQFQETDKKFQETDKKFQETDKKFQETDKKFQETDKKFQETDKKFQETDKQLKENGNQLKENGNKIWGSDKKLEETTDRVNQIIGYVKNQWGKLVEAIFSPNCKEVFRERGIKIETSISNFEVNSKNENLEVDLLLANSKVVILLEIKSAATIKDVEDVKKDIAKFRRIVPFYNDLKVYGAIAALKYKLESDKYAEKIGFFVLSPKGENLVKINNAKEFIPAEF